jgi:hypothetical protein
MPRRPNAYYADLERRLRALIPLVEQLVPRGPAAWYREWLDVGEYGLAVEAVAEQLTPEMSAEARELPGELLPEAKLMGLPQAVVASLDRVCAPES